LEIQSNKRIIQTFWFDGNNYMCRFKFHLLIVLATFGIGLLAVSWTIKSTTSQRVEKEAEPNEIKFVRPRSDYSIGSGDDLLELFRELAELSGKTKKNTFYISKIEMIEINGNRDFELYVYWKEDNSILTFPLPFNKADEGHLRIVYGDRKELNKNIVKKEEEIGNSRKLVTRKIADELIEKCFSSGQKIIIESGKLP
jgi:hypothetical protein